MGEALSYLRPLNRHVEQERSLGIIPVLFHRPNELKETPNKLIFSLKTHQGVEEWGKSPGPAAVVASGMGQGWESCCEILVCVFG